MPTAPPLDAEHLSEIHAAFAHINDDHADTVLFVARHLGAADATSARLVTADTLGVDLTVDGPNGPAPVRMEFAAPIASAPELQAVLMVALGEARAAADASESLTSLEQLFEDATAIPVHMVELVGRRQITPTMIEIDLAGGPGLAPRGPDTFYFALLGDEPGVVNSSYSIDDYRTDEETDRVRGAYYTVRAWDPDRSAVTFWVVLHGPDGGVSNRLADAEIGTGLGLWGPRVDFVPPPDVDAVLLVADETGLAAAAVVIEQLPATARAVAVFEAADADHRPPMPEHPGLTTHWIDRDGRPAGLGTAFVDTVRAIDLSGDGWWAFGGAESRQVTKVRRHVRDDLGWPAERVSMTGYWRLDASLLGGDGSDIDDDDLEDDED
jgi:NADPH-dependent ferric siderophore reductase